MGILNVTPDSFSDGGLFADPGTAVTHGLEMERDGAVIIDVGGESTRPGSDSVPEKIEIERVIPVVKELCRRTKCLISVDTTKSAVAALALEAGAHIINDITALTGDPAMVELARSHNAGVILIHCQGKPATMQDNPQYFDVAGEVSEWLALRIEATRDAGLDPQTIAIDPGIGFGKTTHHNLQILAKLHVLADHARPIVIGLSRKRFLGEISGNKTPAGRQSATDAAHVYAVLQGAHVLRTHDVKAARDVVRIISALQKEQTP